MSGNFLDSVPIWAVYLGLLLLFLAAVEGGYVLGDRRQKATDYVDESRTAQAGIVLGALLTLSALLLAFTFSMAGSQFDSRRQLVIDDVNAIGTAFLRAQSLPTPQHVASRELLAQYVAERATLFDDSLENRLAHADQVQQQLWAEATEVARQAPTPVVSLYMQALNEMIDLHAKRVSVEVWVRIPDLIIATLALLSFATMVLTGYLLGLRERRYGFPTALMIFTYATVFGLVIDLDRPARGLFQVNQTPMEQLSESIRAELANTPSE